MTFHASLVRPRVELLRMHAPVAAYPEDGFALRPSGFPWLRLSLGCAAAMAVLACFVERQSPPATDMPSAPVQLAASAPLPAWTPVARPLSIYEIDAPQLTSLTFALAARRDAAGAREDTLAFGAFDHDTAPHLRVILHRSPDPEGLEPSLFLDLARRASRAGLAVIRSAPAEALATKFGVMEASEVTLSDRSERACLAFRFSHQEVGFRVAGWLCPVKGQAIDRQELACTLDRLSLAEAGNDEPLKILFAQADRQRIGGCAPAPMIGIVEPRSGEGPPKARPPRQARPARAQVPATAAQKGSATPQRGTARGAGSASPSSRG